MTFLETARAKNLMFFRHENVATKITITMGTCPHMHLTLSVELKYSNLKFWSILSDT